MMVFVFMWGWVIRNWVIKLILVWCRKEMFIFVVWVRLIILWLE